MLRIIKEIGELSFQWNFRLFVVVVIVLVPILSGKYYMSPTFAN